jgi:VanZ family protein
MAEDMNIQAAAWRCREIFALGFRSLLMSTFPIIYRTYPSRNSEPWSIWLRAWLPVLAFSTIFAIESTTYFGSNHTSAPLQRVAEAVCGYDMGVYWKAIHRMIRKTGHFMAYGTFSLICFRALWIVLLKASSQLRRKLQAHGGAILITFLVASADEFHQTFLPNRDGTFSDVLLDTCGAVALGLVLFLAVLAVERQRQASLNGQPVYVE